MSNKTSNYPTNKLKEISKEAVKTVLVPLMPLGERGKPQSTEELKERIREFQALCCHQGLYMGVETLAYALGVSSQTLWNWCNGNGCTREWSNECLKARQLISSFTEQATMTGGVSAPVGIFALKNVCGWSDDGIREEKYHNLTPKALTASELPDIPNIEIRHANTVEREWD